MATVLLLTALVEELQPVRDWIIPDHGWTEETDSLNYPIFRGSFHAQGQDSTINVVLASAGEMGGLVTATRATHLISQFQPICVAMSGICAADAKKGARMGDIVVADRVWSHGVSKVMEAGTKANFDTLSVRPNHWLQKLELFCEQFVLQEQALIEEHRRDALNCLDSDLADCGWDKNRFEEVYRYRAEQSVFRPRFGSIVAVQDVTEIDEPFAELQQARRQTISLELESFAIAHAANYNTVPAFLFSKGVQDHARPPKVDTFRRFGSFASALFILRFLQKYIHELSPPSPRFVGGLNTDDDQALIANPRSPILALADRELDESCLRSAKFLTLAVTDANERLAEARLLSPGTLNCDTAVRTLTPAAWRGEISDSWIASLAASDRPLNVNCSCILPAANIVLELLRSKYDAPIVVRSSDLNGVEQMTSANESPECDFLIIANAPFYFHQRATAPDPFGFVMPLFRRSQALLQRRSSRLNTPRSVYVFPESSAAEQVRGTRIQQFADIHDIDASSILPFIEQLNRDEAVVVWEPFASWLGQEREYILNAETRYNIWVSLFARQHAFHEQDGTKFAAFINLFVAMWNLVSIERTRILDPALTVPFSLRFYAATGRRLWQAR